MVGELDTVQLPGQQWTVFPTTRTWSWGGLDEKSVDADPMAIACSPSDIRWKTVCSLVEAFPFQRGYIAALHIFEEKIWWNGWKSMDEASHLPDAVLSIVKRLFDGAETMSAMDLEAQLSPEEVAV